MEEIAQAVTEHKPRPVEQAVVWLNSLLADGPRLQIDIEETAKTNNHAWRTVKRAKQQIGIVSNKRFDRKWEWSLPKIEPIVTALRQAAAASEIEGGHEECQIPPITEVAPLAESGTLKVKEATSSKECHILNRGEVAPLESDDVPPEIYKAVTLDSASVLVGGAMIKDMATAIYTDLYEAATTACSGLKITAGEFISQLDTDDYLDIIRDPVLARATAQSMAERLE